MAGSQTPTTHANAIKSMWDDRFFRRPNENRNITKYATQPEGAEKIGDTIYFRVVPTISANTATSDGTALVYDNTSPDRPSGLATLNYSAVRPEVRFIGRLTDPDAAKYLAAQRAQLLAGLWVQVESAFAQSALTISQQLGAPSNISEALFLQGKGLLRASAKEYADMESGDPQMYLCYHTSQIQYVEAIPAIMHADIRGDKQNPTVQGVVQKGWGFKFTASGNIYTTAGIAYNMIFTPLAFFLGFNQTPKLLDPQPEELTVRYIAYTDSASGELLDECALIFRSPV